MSENSARGFSKERLQALSDGVFSVAMTLLALDLISEEVAASKTADELEQNLLALWPKILSYVISFAVAAAFWVAQHADLHHLERVNNRYIWINIFFLFWISLLPFSANLLGEHHVHAIAEIIYGSNMILATLTLHAGWWYAVRHRHLVKPDLDAGAIRQAHRRLLLGVPIYLVGIGMAFVQPHSSFVLYVITAFLYVLAGLVPERLRLRALKNVDDD